MGEVIHGHRSGGRDERSNVAAKPRLVPPERKQARAAVAEVRPRLLELLCVRLRARERADRGRAPRAQSTAYEQRRDLVDLPLRAVQRAQHLRLTQTERPRSLASTQLVPADEPEH